MPHIHDKVDFTVEVFIVRKNTVLLRKHDKYKIWLSVGGHIELDEDPSEAAVREVKEETGLDIALAGKAPSFSQEDGYRAIIPPEFIGRHRVTPSHEHVVFVYFAKTDSDRIEQGMPNEVSEEMRWFTREDLEDSRYALRENIKFYAEKALEALSSSR